jgi:hypothetical protein
MVFPKSEYTKLDDLRIKLYILRFRDPLLPTPAVRADTPGSLSGLKYPSKGLKSVFPHLWK